MFAGKLTDNDETDFNLFYFQGILRRILFAEGNSPPSVVWQVKKSTKINLGKIQ